MRFITVLLLFSSFASVCYSQDSINKIYYTSGHLKSFQVKKDGSTLYEKDFFENGMVSGEGLGRLMNGKFQATQFKKYYENGSLNSSLCDSLFIAYEEDGKIYMHTELVKGIKNGEDRYYLANRLYTTEQYKNGKKNGLSIIYDLKTGKKAVIENYQNGIQVGSSKHYDNDGHITKEIYYDGECPIKAIYFDINSKPVKIVTDRNELKLTENNSFKCK